MRKVLNNAILTGNVGDDMIACAQTALGEGFEGSLSRSDIFPCLHHLLTVHLFRALAMSLLGWNFILSSSVAEVLRGPAHDKRLYKLLMSSAT